GNIVSYYLNAGPILDEEQELTTVYGIYTDISERKKAEQKIRKAYEEKNTILESFGDAFFAVNNNWIVTYWNKIAEKVLSTPRDKIIGKYLWDIFSESIDSVSYKNYHKAFATKQSVHFEDYFAPLNRWYEISAYPSEQGLAVYFKDISIRKQVEKQIRQSNER